MNNEKPNYPAFDEAEMRVQEFLKSAEWPANVMWVSTDDVAVSVKEFIVHPRKEGREQAIEDYRRGIQKNLGILLTAVCRDDDRTYCIVWTPSDETEAEYALMPQGLKLSAPSEPRQAKIVSGQIKWWWLRRNAKPLQLM
jgi:hypothetical protein